MDSFISRIVHVAAAVFFFHGFCCFSEQAPRFLKDAIQAPAFSYYDYIIVGGGTAGCPLAATLSEKFKVLMLERGNSPYGNRNISNPSSFLDNLFNISPSSPSELFTSTDGVINMRARVLGGGSSINAGFYSRASPEQLRLMGLDGAVANQSYQWVEKVMAFKPQLHQWQSALQAGLLEAGVEPFNGFTYDHMYGTKIGGTIFDEHGQRHNAADLLRHYANPSRLTVLLHATVHQLLFSQAPPAAQGVVFHDTAGVQHTAYLNGNGGEIILAAGAIGSPQLLMLSGIGPKDHLESIGISLLVHQPMVGLGMADNPMNSISIPSPIPVEISLGQQVGITRFGSYIEAISGFDLAGALARTATPGSSTNVGNIIAKVANPLSRGHLQLVSRNPNHTPSITFNYFKEPEDLRTCVESLKLMSRVIESKAFAEFKYPNASVESLLNTFASMRTNLRPRNGNGITSLEQYCNETVITIWHYHGGCQVGKVVDQDYRVMGVDRLRVIDGSTFHFSPGTNPQATLMMLGRYMGLKIQNQMQGNHVIRD